MSTNKTLQDALARIEQWEKENAQEAEAPETVEEHDSSAPAGETWRHVADVAEDQVNAMQQKRTISVKGLDEKAVLVSVKRRMYSPYKIDAAESRAYGAGNVNKHLFTGRDNRVKTTLAKFTNVYTYVNDNTVPWTTGVRMLRIEHYMEFSRNLRQLIAEAEDAVDDLCAHWDEEVQADLDRLQKIAAAKGKPNLVDPSDYPDVDTLRSRFGIEVRYMPVPTTGDFRVGISDEDKASLQRQLEEAEANAARHVVSEMLEPMQRAADKLAVPIGEEGSIFRDSLIENMREVATRMEKVNLSDDPEVVERIRDLRSIVDAYADNKEVLRNSQSVREKAAGQISDLVGKMQGLV